MPDHLCILPVLILYMAAIAFISALETVVGSLSENKLEKQSEDGSGTSARLLKIASEKEKYLASLEVLRFFLIASAAFLASFFKNKYAAFAFISVFKTRLEKRRKKGGAAVGFYRFLSPDHIPVRMDLRQRHRAHSQNV